MTTRREWISGLVLAAGTAVTACVVTAAAQEDVAPAATAGPPPVQPAAGAPAAPVASPPGRPAGNAPHDGYSPTPAKARAFTSGPNDFIRPAPGVNTVTVFGGGFGTPDGFAFQGTNDDSEEMRQVRSDAIAAENETQAALQEFTAAKEESAKTEARSKLRAALQKQFETRQRYRDLEIAQLEAEVKRLRDLHQKREAAKSQIIDARLDQLVRSAEGLGWDGNDGGYRIISPAGGHGGPVRVPIGPAPARIAR